MKPCFRAGAGVVAIGLAMRVGLAILVGLSGLVLVGGGRSARALEQSPPQVTAVLDTAGECVTSSVKGVSTEPAAARVLQPGRVWTLTQGEGVTVAVLGTGFNLDSPQLEGQVTIGPDLVSGGSAGRDCVGHGTFVAGLIVALARAGTTVAGIAPRAHVLGIKVTDDGGATSPGVLARGIDAAVSAKAKIIVIPVVAARSSVRLEKSVARAVERGVIVIAPVAADDQSIRTPVYPGALKDVLTVGDSTADSSSSPAALIPDLTAPGQTVLSVCPGGGVCQGTGPAYAAALVAGTLALVDSYHPGLSRAERLQRLTATAYPVQALQAPPVTYGMVDPYAAVSAVAPDAGVSPAAPVRRGPQPLPPPGQEPAVGAAIVVALAGLGLLVLILCLVFVVPRGRARRWQPGSKPSGLAAGEGR